MKQFKADNESSNDKIIHTGQPNINRTNIYMLKKSN